MKPSVGNDRRLRSFLDVRDDAVCEVDRKITARGNLFLNNLNCLVDTSSSTS